MKIQEVATKLSTTGEEAYIFVKEDYATTMECLVKVHNRLKLYKGEDNFVVKTYEDNHKIGCKISSESLIDRIEEFEEVLDSLKDSQQTVVYYKKHGKEFEDNFIAILEKMESKLISLNAKVVIIGFA